VSAAVVPGDSCTDADTLSPAVSIMRDLLSSDDAEPGQVQGHLRALSDEDMTHYGLRAFRMNLMALLGDRIDSEAIALLARKAAISKLWLGWEYHHHYLSRLDTAPEPAQLRQLPIDTVKALLAQGRGAVIATFHLGLMRHIPSDLAHAGVPVMVPLARDAYDNYESARRQNPDAALWRNFRHVCVEEAAGSLALARGLARGGCVLSTIDGNTGIDGPRGSDRRSIITMLDTKARVKNGLVAMAARFGVPILPVVATTMGAERVCHTSHVIDPEKPLTGEEAATFVETTVSTLYQILAETLLQSADEWCGGDLFHQWRLPRDCVDEPMHEAAQRLEAALEHNGKAGFDSSRVMPLSDRGERVFVDVHTMKCFRLPAAESEFVDLLQTPGRGVTRDWIDGLCEARRPSVWRFLCLLASRGALSFCREASLSLA
jgi:lauroyl/myristoyl acyltransferase